MSCRLARTARKYCPCVRSVNLSDEERSPLFPSSLSVACNRLYVDGDVIGVHPGQLTIRTATSTQMRSQATFYESHGSPCRHMGSSYAMRRVTRKLAMKQASDVT